MLKRMKTANKSIIIKISPGRSMSCTKLNISLLFHLKLISLNLFQKKYEVTRFVVNVARGGYYNSNIFRKKDDTWQPTLFAGHCAGQRGHNLFLSNGGSLLSDYAGKNHKHSDKSVLKCLLKLQSERVYVFISKKCIFQVAVYFVMSSPDFTFSQIGR